MANNLIDKGGKLNRDNYRKKVEKQQETFAKIDAAMAILEKMPELIDVGLDFLNADSFTFATNPMEFLFNILKTLGVEEDELKEWLTETLIKTLPAVEVGVKAFLLSNIKSIISCDFDPRIPWELRKKAGDTVYIDLLRGGYGERGMDISLSTIDPEGMLDLSPFTEPGQEYYFGQSEDVNEDSNSKIAKLVRSDDFNAFLWYMIHKGNRQNPIAVELDSDGTFTYNGSVYTATTVVGTTISTATSLKGVTYLKCPEDKEFIAGTTFCDKLNPKEVLMCIEKKDEYNLLVPISSDWQSCNWYVDKDLYYNNNIKERKGKNERDYTKEKPICNLMYTDIGDYKGSSVTKPPVGLDNIRFTILPKPAIILPSINKSTESKVNWRVVRLLFDADGTPNSKGKYSLPGEIAPTKETTEGSDWVKYKYEGVQVNFNIKTGEYKFNDKATGAKALIECYPGLTVYEFNYDYVMGMKLFDTKVVCKKLLEASTNHKYTANFALTFNKQKDKSSYPFTSGKQRIVDLVRKIMETDDEEINDCFYMFSNEEYDELLEKTARLKYNQSPYTQGYGDGQVIDLSSVDKILADYPDNGTLKEQKDVISRAIEAACANIEDSLLPEYQQNKSSIRINFLTNMFQQLALCLVDCIMSPKVLMLLVVNNTLMQENGTSPITTEQLISMAKNIVTGLIKEVRDLIMQKILDYIIEFLTPMVLKIQEFIASERVAAYMAIIRLLLGWHNMGTEVVTRLNAVLSSILSKVKGDNYDGESYEIPSILDDVNYADIFEYDTNTEKAPIINNC